MPAHAKQDNVATFDEGLSDELHIPLLNSSLLRNKVKSVSDYGTLIGKCKPSWIMIMRLYES